jgi:hypothetical protein
MDRGRVSASTKEGRIVMISLYASSDYGHTGQYIARLVGRDGKFTFRREFVGHKTGKRAEQTQADLDTPGLYECCSVTRKGKEWRYRLLFEVAGELALVRVSKEDAMAIAKALDAGRELAQIVSVERVAAEGEEEPKYTYSLRSAAEARKAEAAQTREGAIAACWSALEALPTSEAKKVLAALRERLAPKAAPASDVAPAGAVEVLDRDHASPVAPDAAPSSESPS